VFSLLFHTFHVTLHFSIFCKSNNWGKTGETYTEKFNLFPYSTLFGLEHFSNVLFFSVFCLDLPSAFLTEENGAFLKGEFLSGEPAKVVWRSTSRRSTTCVTNKFPQETTHATGASHEPSASCITSIPA
jgi:hypothetical protein